MKFLVFYIGEMKFLVCYYCVSLFLINYYPLVLFKRSHSLLASRFTFHHQATASSSRKKISFYFSVSFGIRCFVQLSLNRMVCCQEERIYSENLHSGCFILSFKCRFVCFSEMLAVDYSVCSGFNNNPITLITSAIHLELKTTNCEDWYISVGVMQELVPHSVMNRHETDRYTRAGSWE